MNKGTLNARLAVGVSLVVAFLVLLFVSGGLVLVWLFSGQSTMPVTMNNFCAAVGAPTTHDRDDVPVAGNETETEPLFDFAEDGVLGVCKPSDVDVVIVAEVWDWAD